MTEASAEQVLLTNALLREHNEPISNTFVLGGGVIPSFGPGVAPGSIQATAVDRAGGENRVVNKSKKAPTHFFVTGVVKIVRSFVDIVADMDASAAKEARGEKVEFDSQQTIYFDLDPDDERLASSQPGLTDLKQCFTEQLTKAWYDSGYEPNRGATAALRAKDYTAYAEVIDGLIMDHKSSPYAPLQEVEKPNGEFQLQFKASSKFKAFGTETLPKDKAIAMAAPPGAMRDFVEANPDKRVKFVDLRRSNGALVGPDEYWDFLTASVGPGALVVATLMFPLGGVVNITGGKLSVQPKLTSIQVIEPAPTTTLGKEGAAPDFEAMMAARQKTLAMSEAQANPGVNAGGAEDEDDGDTDDDGFVTPPSGKRKVPSGPAKKPISKRSK